VKWRDIVSPGLVNNAKEIAREVFGRSDVPNDEDGLMARIKEFTTRELMGANDSIKDLLHEYTNIRYPGKQVLEDGKKLLEEIERIKDIKAFYDFLYTEREALLDYEDNVRDVKQFFKNQRSIFDKALKMIDIYEGNRSYVLDPETIKLTKEIERIVKLQTPYSEIRELTDLIDQFASRFTSLLEEECKPIRASIKNDYEATLANLEGRPFKHSFIKEVRNDFDALLDRLSHANNIYEAIAMQTESDRMKQRYIQRFIDEQAQIDAKKGGSVGNTPPTLRQTKTVSAKALFGGTVQITSKADIDSFLADVREKLEAQLEEDTTIQIV
jgi:hypothetical protein